MYQGCDWAKSSAGAGLELAWSGSALGAVSETRQPRRLGNWQLQRNITKLSRTAHARVQTSEHHNSPVLNERSACDVIMSVEVR
jgi:hypothetical protein